MSHWIPSLLFADDNVLLAPSKQDLQHVLGRFAAECEAAGMKISTSKSEGRPEKGGLLPPSWGKVLASNGEVQVPWGLVRE